MRTAADPRWFGLFILTTAVSCSAGCHSALGAAIGAAIPRWDRDVSTSEMESEKGLRVEVHTRDPESALGAYGGTYDGRLLVVTDDDVRAIPLHEVRRVDVRVGSYWATGLLVGLVHDIIFTFVAYQVWRNEHPCDSLLGCAH